MTLLLGFGAVNTGNNLLYLMESALLGFMAVSGLMGHWNLKKIHVRLEPPEEIYAGLETLIRVHLENRRRILPVFLLDVSFEPDTGHSAHIMMAGRNRHESLSVPAMFPQRGIHTRHRLILSSAFPINFFVRQRIIELKHDITVFPRPVACQHSTTTDQAHRDGTNMGQRKGTEGDISRIGNYQGNEPLKMIHWKLSARHDSLKTKELTQVQRPPVEIDPLSLPGANLEQQLSCAAFLIRDRMRDNQAVGLKLGSTTLPPELGPGHKIRLLKELAIYAQD